MVFDKCIAEGAQRVCFSTRPEATEFQIRMCNARSLHRAEQRQLYGPHDPKGLRSPYDHLRVCKPVQDEGGEWWVYIKPHGSNILAIEAA